MSASIQISLKQRINILLRYLFLIYIILFFSQLSFSASAKKPETVVLQLKWKHQFQFAGYYAAIEKGYYKDAGLNVVLKEGDPKVFVEEELLSGRANFGVGMPDILVARQQGKTLVVLAAIFQHSPLALFVPKGSNINTPRDLIGKNVMLRTSRRDIEIRAMLMNEGVPCEKINFLSRTMDVNNLINGKVDASSGYLTDLPLILQKHGVHYSIIQPRAYGIDFYGDCLFTTEREIKEHPQRVKKFLEASLKGWKYAIKHPEEIADLILKKYSTRLSRETLLYEAKAMRELMLPDLVEIGHVNPSRWKHIANTLVKLKMLPTNYSLEGFIYNPRKDHDAKIKSFIYMSIIVAILGLGGLILFIFNRKLTKAVKKQTKQLNDEKLFSDVLIESLPGNFFVFEDGERLIRWNSILHQVSGYTKEELYGMHPLEWFAGNEKKRVADALQTLFEKGRATVEAEITYKKTDRRIPYYHSASILEINGKKYIVGISIDTTEKKQLEAQLIQSQKMESVGRLVGGIAHDFNNILTTIIGYSELILEEMNQDDPNYRQITFIHRAGEKAADLTKQLLAFSRKQILEKRTVSINTTVGNFLKLLGRVLGEKIEIKTFLDAESGITDADPGQIEQILMNLAINAKDAMPNGGEITFETADIVIDTNYEKSHLNITPGKYVMLAVTDSGEGMDKEVIKHIFDPFFTTKEKGKGTGLGLATVYGIVKQHDSYIYVYSELGRGTTFKIYFPASSKTAEPNDKNIRTAPMPTGNETIIVVDDEDTIRKLIVDTLEPLGYKCLVASCGSEVLDIADKYKNKIHLLLTDVIMTGMNGKELSEKMRIEHPDIKILFMSGYTENLITHNGILDSNINYIPKPITPVSLTRKIRRILDN